MSEMMIFDLLRQGLWVAVLISAPLLTVALVAGVVVGLFQALTSIQEMTLTFVPKAGLMLVVFWASMSFMTTTLVAFFQDTIIPQIVGIPQIAGG
jgi:flagellar biosynthetic protein FliQ